MNGEKLACKHDTREEAQLFDGYTVGIYLDEGEGIEIKLGHIVISFTMQIFSPKRMSSRVLSNWIKVLGRRTWPSPSHSALMKKTEKLLEGPIP